MPTPFCLSKNTIDPMRVQISTILHAEKQYSYDLAFLWMASQSHKPVSFYIAVHTGEYGEKHKLKMLRERCREDALESGADAMFFFDCDTIPPLDAIEQLLGVPGDIVSGIYYSRLPGATDRAVCWKHGDPEQDFLNTEHVSEIDGAGMGCCLIHRRVMEHCTFDYEVPDDDYPFWDQAIKFLNPAIDKGFRLRSLNTLRCRHYQTADAFIHHPFGKKIETRDNMYEYQIQCPDGVTINGEKYQGKATADQGTIGQIRMMDAPYREGDIKASKRVASHMGKEVIAFNPFTTKPY
jgi:hypothetical protein